MSTVSPSPNLSVPLPRNTRGGLDRFGIALSSACAIHCVVMPFVVGYLAYLGHDWVASESTELLLVGSAFLVAVGSLLPSYLKHRNPAALGLFALGLGLIVALHLTGWNHGVGFGVVMAVGGAMIAGAHWWNHRLCACCQRHRH
ncbi:MAG: MerC family mercury resistance protein [Bryobacterales bacterium]|nr:MerC family mercury resistance protein [Bryobacterales bacterium]